LWNNAFTAFRYPESLKGHAICSLPTKNSRGKNAAMLSYLFRYFYTPGNAAPAAQ